MRLALWVHKFGIPGLTLVITKVKKFFRAPWFYIGQLRKLSIQSLSYVFRGTSFYLQGQMDIHPKSKWHSPEFVTANGGFFPSEDHQIRKIHDLEPWDSTRRDMLVLLLRNVVAYRVPGDLAEVGVYKGRTARLIHHYLPERDLHLFDTFEGFGERGVATERQKSGLDIRATHFSDTSLEAVKAFVGGADDKVHFYKGYFPDSIPDTLLNRKFAFVHLDADLFDPIIAGLEFFHARLSSGGILLVHDFNAWPGARLAVEDFCRQRGVVPIPMPDKSGSALITKP